jgi:predicted flap endonuclease-1-like 5' DNA nuclease
MADKSKTRTCGLRWWDWALVVVGLPALALILWVLRRRTEQETPPDIRIEITVPSHPVEVITPAAAPLPVSPDDLRRIDGIGPKISGALQGAGITTFAQLAAADVGQLRQILREAGVRVTNPTTWPEQAGLAAVGQWDELGALQATLKGGRRAQES